MDYAYDPKLAKQLLTEAGFPDGFSTTLVTYMLSAFDAAVQNYLKVIGINANIQDAPGRRRSSEGARPARRH